MESILTITNLNKKYGSLQAVKNLSFEVQKGNVYGLLGANGSGKSTTLSIILNAINSTSGSWLWFGEKPNTDSLKRIGAIIEKPNFYPYLSIVQNLKIVAEIKGVNYDKIVEKLSLVGLSDRQNELFSTFSLGMKQRVAIASALLNDPEVLILDEPTNGLDPSGILQIREIIKTISQQGVTIILASHLLDEVEKVCTHVVVLQKGVALYAGPIEKIVATKGYFELSSAFNKDLVHQLETFGLFTKIEEKNKYVIAHIDKEIAAEDLNKMLFDHGILLNHLVKRKDSLEKQFFELIKNN